MNRVSSCVCPNAECDVALNAVKATGLTDPFQGGIWTHTRCHIPTSSKENETPKGAMVYLHLWVICISVGLYLVNLSC